MSEAVREGEKGGGGGRWGECVLYREEGRSVFFKAI